ncbi:hypothetical protein [Agarilytica rhodophyticola]|uniref:hypothetical protein n=1 Tax=Agarilytica rhodophyticola TaxID=1737490 RepID=UPI000B344A72|nr:hypothetical protein [Agarilytica rhodophyticola]
MSQGEIPILLEPNQEERKVDFAGDFLFLKESARPVKVIVDGQPITMREGDKRVFRRSEPGRLAFDNFQVTNKSDLSLRCVFVAGTGDYNSQVVRGEFTVSENIQTTALATNSLPLNIKKTFGYVDINPVSYERNEEFIRTQVFDTVNEGLHRSLFLFDGFVWSVTKTQLRKFSMSGALLESHAISGDGDAFDSGLRGAAVTPEGIVYIVGLRVIGRLDMNTKSYSVIYTNPAGQFFPEIGVAYRNGFLTLIRRSDSNSITFSRFNVLTLEIEDVVVGVTESNGALNRLSYYEKDDLLLIGNSTGRTFFYDAETLQYTGVQKLLAINSPLYVPEFNLQVEYITDAYVFRVIDPVDYVARLYIQDGSDVTTRNEFLISGDAVFFPRGDKTVMRGEILKYILQGLSAGRVIEENYMDYVTSLTYSDGRNNIVKSAGSATFSYRGYSDVGELILPSEVEVKIMPEYLTEVV